MTLDLQAVRAEAERIAAAAGEEVMRYFNQPHTEIEKSNLYDVVTEGDKASEAVIVPALRAAFPDHAIVSEEGGGTEVGHTRYVWYIDPIDGTTNFATNLPFFCISMGLAEHGDDGRILRPVVGVVYNPVYREMFSAAHGFGATLNGQPIHVTRTAALNRAVMSTGFSYYRHTVEDNNLRAWEAMLFQVRDMRRFGSAALDLAFTAAGRLDAYWERYINPWDVMAGICLVQEAGGQVSDYANTTEHLYSDKVDLVATNGLLHADVLRVLNTA